MSLFRKELEGHLGAPTVELIIANFLACHDQKRYFHLGSDEWHEQARLDREAAKEKRAEESTTPPQPSKKQQVTVTEQTNYNVESSP